MRWPGCRCGSTVSITITGESERAFKWTTDFVFIYIHLLIYYIQICSITQHRSWSRGISQCAWRTAGHWIPQKRQRSGRYPILSFLSYPSFKLTVVGLAIQTYVMYMYIGLLCRYDDFQRAWVLRRRPLRHPNREYLRYGEKEYSE